LGRLLAEPHRSSALAFDNSKQFLCFGTNSEAAATRMVNMSKSPWIVIAGGGTAGHVLPALAIANELRSTGTPASSIHFVGSKRGLEGRLVTEAGFPITLLSGRGIQRKLTLDNVGAIGGLVIGALRAVALLTRKRPAVVFSVGGYASTPCALAARLLRIPLVQAESNARAGKAISTFAGYAKATAVQFDSTGLPHAELVGNPVRPEVLALFSDRAASTLQDRQHQQLQHQDRQLQERQHQARGDLGYPAEQQFVAVFGGSLGARKINEAVFALMETWADRPLSVHHVIGDRDFASAQQWLRDWTAKVPLRALTYHQIRYEDRMDLVYAAADVFVCRAGGTSIADLAIAGVPAILVPLPSAAEDHQSANAQGVVADGGAVCVSDNDCTAQRLEHELSLILNDRVKHEAMSHAQLGRARPNAAPDIVALLDRFASRPRLRDR
jgi:UDP-N-acetylglucosamine--N-acetylmuramyl-(pentapeptide) pyrophosphoryl-undecaprenol N-acetylglucosamine transferase